MPRRIFTETGSAVALGDRLDDAGGVLGVVEERGAGAGLRHLAHRAAEVDVDDVGAGGLDHPRGLGHRDRVGAEDLDRERVLVGGDAEVPERPLVAVLDPRDRDHLRADEAGAVAAALPAERLDADAGHRREDEAAGDLDPAEKPVLVQVDLHRVPMVAGGPCAARSASLLWPPASALKSRFEGSRRSL